MTARSATLPGSRRIAFGVEPVKRSILVTGGFAGQQFMEELEEELTGFIGWALRRGFKTSHGYLSICLRRLSLSRSENILVRSVLKPALDKAEVKVGNSQNKITSFNNSSLFGFESPKGEASIYQRFN